MNKKNFVFVPLIAFCTSLQGQMIAPNTQGYYVEALADAMETQTGGSARVQGIAGVQTALGADLGALSSNPAGLGLYRKSEVVGSLGLSLSHTSSTLYGNTIVELKPHVNVSNLGIAICFLRDDLVSTKWRGGTLAFGMNTLQSYQNRFSYDGVNQQNSFINSLEEKAYGTDPSVYDNEYSNNNISSLPSLGYSAYLISYDNSYNPPYISYIPPDKIMEQKSTVNTSGAVRSWSVGYGGNYNDRFFFGGSLNVLGLSRKIEQTYTEVLLNAGSGNNYLTNFTFADAKQVNGTGVNLTVGAIYKFTDVFRMGASIKTPDYYGIRETYNASINANYNNIELSYQDGTPYYLNNASATLTTTKFKYQLYSPMKANLGMSFFMGKLGFFSLDFQYINYKGMFLTSGSTNYLSGDNTTIKNVYRDVITTRAGLEIRADIVRLRAGIGYLPSPYNTNVDDRIKRVVSDATLLYSTGIGIKLKAMSLDLSYTLTQYSSNYSPYTLNNAQQPLVQTNNSISNVVLSFSGNF